MKQWVYLSHSLNEKTPVYGGREGLQCVATPHGVHWQLPQHIGTHIDFPAHFFEEAHTAEHFEASFWVFEKVVVVNTPKEPSAVITVSDLEPHAFLGMDALLVNTHFEMFRHEKKFWEENPGFHPDVAPWLRESFPSLRVLGVDAISISRWQNRDMGRQAHRGFLDPQGRGHPILLLEDVSFQALGVKDVLEQVYILPLRVEGADGAPCTVLGQIKRTA